MHEKVHDEQRESRGRRAHRVRHPAALPAARRLSARRTSWSSTGPGRASGSLFRWSTSGASRNPTIATRSSFAPKPFAWKRCCRSPFRKARYSMAGRDGVSRSLFDEGASARDGGGGGRKPRRLIASGRDASAGLREAVRELFSHRRMPAEKNGEEIVGETISLKNDANEAGCSHEKASQHAVCHHPGGVPLQRG